MIYQNHYGSIPRDSDNRSYDIHHRDGDHSNNDHTNLVALTGQEHYDIHYQQGDYGACLRLAKRLNISPEETSRLATLSNQKRINAGTHNFLDKENAKIRSNKIMAEGKCNLVGDRNPVHRLVESGIHHFQNPEFSRTRALKRSANGTHNFQGSVLADKLLAEGRHPTQRMKTCEHCGVSLNAPLFGRYHGDRCRTILSQEFLPNPVRKSTEAGTILPG